MPLTGTSEAWATAAMATITQTGLTPGEIASIKAAWKALFGVHISHLTANSLILTTGVTATGTPGGPLTITSQPGVLT